MGDLRISTTGVGFQGAHAALGMDKLSANSKAAGDYTEARQVDGQTVYLTKGGAEAYDKLKDEADGTIMSTRVEKHPSAISDAFWSNHDLPASVGKTK